MTATLTRSAGSVAWGPATATTLRRLATTGRGGRDLTALGIALHHFTDILALHVDLPDAELHQANTILTKQVRKALGSADPIGVVRRLVADPLRCATGDGRSAAELCGPAWMEIEAIVVRRADMAVEGSRTYGVDAITKLASLHASVASFPWWDTEAWERQVDRWSRRDRRSPLVRTALLRSPDRLDRRIVQSVLDA